MPNEGSSLPGPQRTENSSTQVLQKPRILLTDNRSKLCQTRKQPLPAQVVLLKHSYLTQILEILHSEQDYLGHRDSEHMVGYTGTASHRSLHSASMRILVSQTARLLTLETETAIEPMLGEGPYKKAGVDASESRLVP